MIVSLIYYAVPKGHVPWRGVWPGALFVTLTTAIANGVFPVYLGQSSVDQIGGALGFILVALVWFYIVSLALLAGAVINALRFEFHETGSVEEERARAFADLDALGATGVDARRAAARIASAERRLARLSNELHPGGSRTTVSVARPSISGRATPTSTGVTSPIHSDERRGVSSGTGTWSGGRRSSARAISSIIPR